jgi:HEPN domain-containing protein
MDDGWYFCLEHRRVEPRLGCRDAERLGPYATREEAERALETAQRRNIAWDDDPRWNDERS